MTGTGFTADEKVTASLPSRNQGQLGSAVADVDGRVSIPVRVPTSLPDGDQEVLLTGTSGERASTASRCARSSRTCSTGSSGGGRRSAPTPATSSGTPG